ncbi:DUF6493 family protein [Actinoplanes derwentensis]|nr:DUF6493 family protein [Actinoplanes derwentensis]GID90088.1 hypothetical protein Ade03nite_90120 [Actinoplanes derwentensis]
MIAAEQKISGGTATAPGVAALTDAATGGDVDRVLELLAIMDDPARRAARRPLDVAQKTMAADAPWEVRTAVAFAALGCRTTPAEAAKDLVTLWRRHRYWSGWAGRQLNAFTGRGPAWLADTGRRVAAAVPVRRPVDWRITGHDNATLYRVARELLWMAGAEPEAGDGYVLEWALSKQHREGELCLAPHVRVHRSTYQESMAQAFRTDPYTTAFLPRVFALAGFSTYLNDSEHWRAQLIALTETGEVARATLIDRCVEGLMSGGRVPEIRGFQKLLAEVDPTEDELAERAADWAGLAGRADAPTAGRALESLRRLRDAGRLDTGLLAETSYAVLSRPEKTLVRSHLKLLAEALRRTPEDAADLLPPIATAFGHTDTTVQEQAWKLVAQHLTAVGDAVRGELADALPGLTPDLRDRAAAVLGTPATATESQTPPIVVSAPLPVTVASGGAAEAVEEIAALLSARRPVPVDRERAVDGLIRAAYRDRAALAEHLVPVVRRQSWIPAGLYELLKAALGEMTVDEVPVGPRGMAGRSDHARCIPCLYEYLLEARWYEAARRLLTEPVPFLLAAPGWSNGALDAAVLVERLTEYARLGLHAGHVDLDQALLRARLPEPAARDRLAAEAAAIGTPDGVRLARWLESGGIHAGRDSGPDVEARTARPDLREGFTPDFRYAQARTALPALRDGFTPHFRHLDQILDSNWHFGTDFASPSLPEWIAVVPVFREYLADQLTNPLDHPQSLDDYLFDLPLLIETDGPAGHRLTMVFAGAIVSAGTAHRPAAVDALLQADARGELDAQWCGEVIGRWATRRGEMFDIVGVLTDLAHTGAHRPVWNILRALLPALLALPKRPRKLSGVLLLAADCAVRIGATGEVPGLSELAAVTAASQAVKQARRLRDALAAGVVATSGSVI